MTIHKARGCEFPGIVIPIAMMHYLMHRRNLIYTGTSEASGLWF
jgi:ATP-dependent exoDNAse (exonuclease V) alpha subunit